MYIPLGNRDAAVTGDPHDSECVHSGLSQSRQYSVPQRMYHEVLWEFQAVYELVDADGSVTCRRSGLRSHRAIHRRFRSVSALPEHLACSGRHTDGSAGVLGFAVPHLQIAIACADAGFEVYIPPFERERFSNAQFVSRMCCYSLRIMAMGLGVAI